MSRTCGTPGYIAPEVILEKYTKAVDIWSWGIIMWEMAFTTIPWTGGSFVSILEHTYKDPLPLTEDDIQGAPEFCSLVKKVCGSSCPLMCVLNDCIIPGP